MQKDFHKSKLGHELRFSECFEILSTQKSKLDQTNDKFRESEELRNKLLEKLEGERTDIEYPVYNFNEGVPRTIDVTNDKKSCYLWIECFEKNFPCHIVTNQKGVSLEVCIKFFSLEDLVDLNLSFCQKTNINSLTKQELLHVLKKIKFSNLPRPGKDEYDLYMHGNILHVNPPKNTGNNIPNSRPTANSKDLVTSQNLNKSSIDNLNNNFSQKKCDFMLCFLYTPIKKKVIVSFSFTSEKYLIIKSRFKFDLFGPGQKKELFGTECDEYTVEEEIRRLKRDRHDRYLSREDIVKKNIDECSDAPYKKAIQIKRISTSVDDRRKRTQNKKKIIYDQNMNKKLIFNQRHEIIKETRQETEEQNYTILNKYMEKYFWTVLIKLYRLLKFVKKQFYVRKTIRFKNFMQHKMLCNIQKNIRTYFGTKEHLTKDIVIISYGFRFRSYLLRDHVHDMAKEVVGIFLSSTLSSIKLKYHSLQFILYIKNIQRRFIKHMKIKRAVYEKFENMWSKHVMLLTEKYNEYKKMGILYNVDDLKYTTSSVRTNIIKHLFDRQMLKYIEKKYEMLEKKHDKKLAKKANLLSLELHECTKNANKTPILCHESENCLENHPKVFKSAAHKF